MNSFSDSYRRLAALAEIASDDKVTQRLIAARLGISLGLANALLRELEADGLVRVKREPANVSRYVITRAGRDRTRALSAEFASEAAALLQRCLGSRQKAVRLLTRRRASGGKRGD